jgi:anti-sigma regulatory factor (Ser/Thr protein kinase)
MKNTTPLTFKVKFPSNADYIPPIRKFVSEVLLVEHFNSKFSFRSEVIVDEICYNAVSYGSHSMDATVDLICSVFSDRVEFQINDEGGTHEHMDRLKKVIEKEDDAELDVKQSRSDKGLGLEIVKMLSAKVNLKIKKDNVTSIQVIKHREDA